MFDDNDEIAEAELDHTDKDHVFVTEKCIWKQDSRTFQEKCRNMRLLGCRTVRTNFSGLDNIAPHIIISEKHLRLQWWGPHENLRSTLCCFCSCQRHFEPDKLPFFEMMNENRKLLRIKNRVHQIMIENHLSDTNTKEHTIGKSVDICDLFMSTS